MYSMNKCSSILQGLLHDELLVSNITFSIIIEKNSGPLLWLVELVQIASVACFRNAKESGTG